VTEVPSPPAVEFRHVTFSRNGARPVLHDVSFAVAPGETVTLVGRSGAGKSTILKLINRLLEPQDGSVLVEGRDTRAWDPYELRRHAGYVLQEVGLFPHMTAGANIAVVPRLLGWEPARVSARVDELLALVGLDSQEYGQRWPDELSGGQRQRVGIARALAGDPPLVLMDEPFGALDPITRSELRTEFRRIQRSLRKTVLLVTHDITEARLLGDRLGVVDDGVLIALGTPAEIAREPDGRVRKLLDTGDPA
jgi:osmoprotectant transport system ATP-binding protein